MIQIFPLLTFFILHQAYAVDLIYEPSLTVPLVYFSVVAPAGSAHDPDGKEGLIHLVGEMVLRGSQRHSKDSFHQQIDSMGAKIAETTYYDSIHLSGAVLASELPRFWSLVTDALRGPSFQERELQLLKNELHGEILEELGNDDLVVKKHFLGLTLGPHPYGRAPRGTLKSLKAISINDLKQTFKRLFRPQGTLLAVAGDLTKAQAEEMKLSLEAALRDKQDEIPFPPLTPPSSPSNSRLLIVERSGRSQSRVLVGKVGPSLQSSSYDRFLLANHSFGGPYFGARLLREIRTKRGWSYGAGTVVLSSKMPNAWYITYAPKTADVLPSVNYVKSLIEEIAQHGQSKADLEFALQNLVKGSAFQVNTAQKRLAVAIQEAILNLPKGHHSRLAQRMAKISSADANKTFSEFLASGPLSWVVLGSSAELKEPLMHALKLRSDQISVIPFDEL